MNSKTVEDLLQQLVNLTRVGVYPVAKNMLRDEFFDGNTARMDRVKIYAHLDGRPQAEVAKKAGVSQSTVSSWSLAWKRKGIVTDDGLALFNVYDYFPELEDK